MGADPGKEIVRFNGECALIFLLLAQVITPLKEVTGINLVSLRRMLGLFCFMYACVHFISYVVFLLEFRFSDLITDIVKRPYISVGFTAFIFLIPLAVTSTRWMVSRLGRSWKILHRLVYLVLLLVLLHLVWLTKTDYSSAFAYVLLGLILLLFRAWRWFRKSRVKNV